MLNASLLHCVKQKTLKMLSLTFFYNRKKMQLSTQKLFLSITYKNHVLYSSFSIVNLELLVIDVTVIYSCFFSNVKASVYIFPIKNPTIQLLNRYHQDT